MFSRRSAWDLRANALARERRARQERGEPLFDLTLSDPTRAGIAYPDEVAQILRRYQGRLYRPEPLGLESARQAICRYYGARGVRVAPEQVLLTASTSEAYAFLFKLLADPGDQVLVPAPSYPLFEFLARLDGVETCSYPLRYAGSWSLDLDRLAARVSERTCAAVLVSPNNPTGSFVKAGERRALEALAGECGWALVADEVFADYPVEGGGGPCFAAEAEVLSFALSGLSKVLGLPQAKLGWLVAAGPGWEEAVQRLELVADTYLSVGTAVQEALPELLGLRGPIQQRIDERVRGNFALLRQAFREGGRARLLTCEGGWCAVLEAEGMDEERAALELLCARGVLVHPGYFYDFAREGYLVLSLLAPDFARGAERLVDYLSDAL